VKLAADHHHRHKSPSASGKFDTADLLSSSGNLFNLRGLHTAAPLVHPESLPSLPPSPPWASPRGPKECAPTSQQCRPITAISLHVSLPRKIRGHPGWGPVRNTLEIIQRVEYGLNTGSAVVHWSNFGVRLLERTVCENGWKKRVSRTQYVFCLHDYGNMDRIEYGLL
jgi:hypothetical protein